MRNIQDSDWGVVTCEGGIPRLIELGWDAASWRKYQAGVDAEIRRSREIYELERGRKYISWEELSIINDYDMPYSVKWERVTAIRQARADKRAGKSKPSGKAKVIVMPRKFEERITQADSIHARGLGIRLVD